MSTTTTAPKLELVDIDALVPHEANPNEGDVGAICDLIVHNGWFGQTLVQAREGAPDRIFVGEHRWRALRMLQAQGGVVRENGSETPLDYAALRARAEALDLPALPPVGKCWVQRYAISDRLARRHMLADNRAHDLASYDDQQLAALLREIADEDGLVGTGFDDAALDDLLRDLAEDSALPGGRSARLADRFILPPFSVLDARQGYWQERKRAWLALGIQSELGRGGSLTWADEAATDDTSARIQMRRTAPGGSPRPATSTRGGRTVRGDGAGRPLERDG